MTATASALLAWYDRHQRVLPWRALPGEKPDPYHVWLSEVMLQQTTVQTVKSYFERFLERFPTIEALANAPSEAVMQAWAGLGYYSRARNLHACAKVIVEQYSGLFPNNEALLLKLPGIGAYTAGAISAIAFNQPSVAVDGNVERVLSRLVALEVPLPRAKPMIRTIALSLMPADRPGDFAQAMMDLGATICTPKKPACALCPWVSLCKGKRDGIAETLPLKAAKKTGPLRLGAAFIALRTDDYILLRDRPPRGLLGSMTEVPNSEWSASFNLENSLASAPFDAQWQRLPGSVRHVFTHFPLELTVYCTTVPASMPAPPGSRWQARSRLSSEALPTVMKKVLAHAAIA